MDKASFLSVILLAAIACTPAPDATPAPVAPPTVSTAPDAPPSAPAPVATLMGSCFIQGVACSDYYGAVEATTLKTVCASVGTWSDTACPAEGQQGTCTKSEPGGIVNKTHSYAPGTPEIAKQACDNTPGGTFTPAT